MSGTEARAGAVLVVGDGDVPLRAELDGAWPGWDADVSWVIGADGGAARAEACLGATVDLVVGDADSLSAAAVAAYRSRGIAVRLAPQAKDESDLELALLAALERAPARIVVTGALGGARIDHELAAIALLAHPALAGTETTIVDARARIRLLRGPAGLRLPGPVGGLVSLLPAGPGVEGVTTAGLEYPLRDEPLEPGPARGLSNVRVATDAAVSLRRGLLLVVEVAEGVEIARDVDIAADVGSGS